MSTRRRLDAELVRRGLARSREHAAELVSAGRVAVAGQAAGKTATQVGQDEPITVQEVGADPGYASRGGGKLAGALAAFPALRWPAAAAWTRARPPAASPTCCCGPAPPRWWRWTWDTASSPGRCAATTGSPCWTG